MLLSTLRLPAGCSRSKITSYLRELFEPGRSLPAARVADTERQQRIGFEQRVAVGAGGSQGLSGPRHRVIRCAEQLCADGQCAQHDGAQRQVGIGYRRERHGQLDQPFLVAPAVVQCEAAGAQQAGLLRGCAPFAQGGKCQYRFVGEGQGLTGRRHVLGRGGV